MEKGLNKLALLAIRKYFPWATPKLKFIMFLPKINLLLNFSALTREIPE